MSTPFIGEIRIFAGNFAPVGWAFCEGQLMPISENDALFNLIGTTYGGDGQETFGLPDLSGRLPVHADSSFTLGDKAGAESVTLSVNQIPTHNHGFMASTSIGNQTNAAGAVLSNSQAVTPYVYEAPVVPMSNQSISPLGGSQPHDNFQPYLCVNFIISLFGIFPHQ